MLPRFEPAGHVRPVALVQPGTALDAAWRDAVAPYVAVEADLVGDGPVALHLTSGGTTLTGTYDGALALRVTTGGRTTGHRSRRSSVPGGPVAGVGLALTGTHLSVLSRDAAGAWTARARVDLADRVDTRDESWLTGLAASVDGVGPEHVRSGRFGQLGLRDLRVVSEADGTPVREEGGRVLLSATSAGPGFFDTAHTSLWSLDPDSVRPISSTEPRLGPGPGAVDLAHRADLFFRRPDRPGVLGDHATHVVRDDGRWLVATSTWGDFDRAAPGASVGVTLAEVPAGVDVTRGAHVLDTRALVLPTTGLRSVGVWDPHLVRDGDRWLVAYVSARRFFRFHPVLAAGPTLDDLTLLGAAADRRATEGPVLAHLDGAWRVLASDGRDGRSGQRARYPVLDVAPGPGPGGRPGGRHGGRLVEVGALDAPYPSNLPWPTLLEDDEGWLMIGFDGQRHGGRVVGYGSHGRVVLARARRTRERRTGS